MVNFRATANVHPPTLHSIYSHFLWKIYKVHVSFNSNKYVINVIKLFKQMFDNLYVNVKGIWNLRTDNFGQKVKDYRKKNIKKLKLKKIHK